jgi:hypothetical protein
VAEHGHKEHLEVIISFARGKQLYKFKYFLYNKIPKSMAANKMMLGIAMHEST